MKKSNNLSFDDVINNFGGIFFWSSDSDKTQIQYSENITSVTGFSDSELKNLKDGWPSMILKEDLEEYRKKLDAFEKDPERDYINFDYRIARKEGTVVHLSERIKLIRGSDGKIVKRLGMVLDATNQLEEFENLKRKNENLEQLNSSKDNFISILSHDLRAPFTSILGFSEIILNESKLPEKDKVEYIKFIHDSSQSQLQLINHLFDWSHLQTGRIKLEIQRLHAQSITYNCVSYLTGLAVRKNINIDVKVPEAFHIDADERLITKVLINLISNAVKFSPVNELVEISANIYNSDFIEFIVKDNGVGISENNREKVFDIGKIFTTEGTKGEKGSGLGLMLAKLVIEKHGGQIWFYSKDGKGSEFHFTVPAAASTILLVLENNEKLSNLKQEMEQSFPGLKVVATENAFEALEKISVKLPSLLICEHNLPLMDGLQFVNTVREKHKNIQLPFIVFLYSDSEALLKSYQEIGVKTIKQEPSLSVQLKEKIESLLVM
jgi:two-component system sensor histidine kinase/response regulator